jgi:hypothetical protein
MAFLMNSSLLYCRQVVICVQNSQRFLISKIELTLDRWPVLVAKVITDVEQTIKADKTAGLRSEGDQIIRELIALKEDMERDRPLKYFLLFS